MSFELANLYANQMNRNSSERATALAIVAALESTATTVTDASATIRKVGNTLDLRLMGLNQGTVEITATVENLKREIQTLNTNLRTFDAEARDLGEKANRLTFWLLIFAAVSSFATVVTALAAIAQIIWQKPIILQLPSAVAPFSNEQTEQQGTSSPLSL